MSDYIKRFLAFAGMCIVFEVLAAAHEHDVKQHPTLASVPSALRPNGGAPFVAAPILWKDDFDSARKNADYDWCFSSNGVPSMTFEDHVTHSNVICIKKSAVIPIPATLPP